MDNLINGILDLVADFERENLKDNIRLAFQQAEHERLFLIKRVTEGKSKSEPSSALRLILDTSSNMIVSPDLTLSSSFLDLHNIFPDILRTDTEHHI